MDEIERAELGRLHPDYPIRFAEVEARYCRSCWYADINIIVPEAVPCPTLGYCPKWKERNFEKPQAIVAGHDQCKYFAQKPGTPVLPEPDRNYTPEDYVYVPDKDGL